MAGETALSSGQSDHGSLRDNPEATGVRAEVGAAGAVLRALRHAQTGTATDRAAKRAALRAVDAIEAATITLEIIRGLLVEAQETLSRALIDSAPQAAALAQARYAQIREDIDRYTEDAERDGLNLLRAGKPVELVLPGRAQPTHAIRPMDASCAPRGLDLPPVGEVEAFDATAAAAAIDLATARLERIAAVFRADAALLSHCLQNPR